MYIVTKEHCFNDLTERSASVKPTVCETSSCAASCNLSIWRLWSRCRTARSGRHPHREHTLSVPWDGPCASQHKNRRDTERSGRHPRHALLSGESSGCLSAWTSGRTPRTRAWRQDAPACTGYPQSTPVNQEITSLKDPTRDRYKCGSQSTKLQFLSLLTDRLGAQTCCLHVRRSQHTYRHHTAVAKYKTWCGKSHNTRKVKEHVVCRYCCFIICCKLFTLTKNPLNTWHRSLQFNCRLKIGQTVLLNTTVFNTR